MRRDEKELEEEGKNEVRQILLSHWRSSVVNHPKEWASPNCKGIIETDPNSEVQWKGKTSWLLGVKKIIKKKPRIVKKNLFSFSKYIF